MKLKTLLMITLMVIIGMPTLASAGLVYGPDARTQFETYRDTLGDTFMDFEDVPTGRYHSLPGISFDTTAVRWPDIIDPWFGPIFVEDYHRYPNHQLMGESGYQALDGQSRYEITFNDPQLRVGIFRPWNTYSLTSFYAGSTLLGTHQNTMDFEFVGFVSDSANITRIVMDGEIETLSTGREVYQVGAADDLFFGSRPSEPIPEPATMLLLGSGLVGLAGTKLRKKKK